MSADTEFAIKKDIRNNPVVRGVDPQQRREFRRTVTLAAMILAMVLFSVWQHFEVVRSGYELERLRREQSEEASYNRKLRLEMEMLRAPQRLEERAVKELHLVVPPAADTIVIERVPPPTSSKAIIALSR
jgi:cell division protein FtsL